MKKYSACPVFILFVLGFQQAATAQIMKGQPTAVLVDEAGAGASQCDAVAGNLVRNCGFETGDFTNWVQSGDLSYTGVDEVSRHTGNFGAFLGPINDLGFIAQQLPTVAGQRYDLSFWRANQQQPNRFQVYWNGVLIFDAVNLPDSPYAPYVFNGLMATGDVTELKFGFFNVPSYLYLDDIVVGGGLTGAVVGTVTDAATGNPIRRATVTAVQGGVVLRSATTDFQGDYRLPNLAPGNYDVTVRILGYAAQTQAAVVAPGVSTRQDFALMANTGAIAGQVTRAAGGAGVRGAIVTARQGGVARGSTRTDGDGNYRIDNLDPGAYDVTASAAGLVSQTQNNVMVVVGGAAVANFALDAVPPGSIAGQVTDFAGGAPIVGALVEARQRGFVIGNDTTDAAGNYNIGNLTPGNYDLAVSAATYGPQTRNQVPVTSGNITTRNFQLRQVNGAIAGQVTRASDGTPVGGAIVRARSGGIFRGGAITNVNGNYAINNLPPGTHDLTAVYAGLRAQTLPGIVVPPGGVGQGDFALQGLPYCPAGAAGGLVNQPVCSPSGASTNGISEIALGPGQGVSFEQIEFIFTEGLVDNSDWGRVIADPGALFTATGICSGYINVYTDAGWVVENLLVDGSDGMGVVNTYFSFGTEERVASSQLSAYAVFSRDPKLDFSDGARNSFSIDTSVYNAQGVADPVTDVDGLGAESDDERGAQLIFLPDGSTQTFTEPNATLANDTTLGGAIILPNAANVQAANNQCFTIATANSLQYMKNQGYLTFPNDHVLGLRGDNTLVGRLDTLANRPAVSRFSGQGTPTRNMLRGKLDYMAGAVPPATLARLVHRHQGRGWRSSSLIPPANDPNLLLDGPFSSSGLTSLDNGNTVTWNWICSRIQEGAGVVIGFSFDDAQGRPRGGHAVRVFECGVIRGVPWIGYLHDKWQTDQDPSDCIGLETVREYAIDAPGGVNLGLFRGRKIRVALSSR